MIKPENAKALTVKNADRIKKRYCRKINRMIKRTAKRDGMTYITLSNKIRFLHPEIFNKVMIEYNNQGYKIEYNSDSSITLSWAEEDKQ